MSVDLVKKNNPLYRQYLCQDLRHMQPVFKRNVFADSKSKYNLK
jgi:hypothetical protein